ncbi:hypothetical protein [Geodermatophilus sp. CPCC 206100]|uniref:hypothetical protein n=1 Tax=Geodermatophilus sp. CPCC 206100 TaxID=3020054 RepID=UPI003AFF7DC6
MVWVVLVLLGLGIETVVIILLGRHATAGWQPEDRQVPSGSVPVWATEVATAATGAASRSAAGHARRPVR